MEITSSSLLFCVLATTRWHLTTAKAIKCEHVEHGRDSSCILIDSKSECEDTPGCKWVGAKNIIGPVIVILIVAALIGAAIWWFFVRKRAQVGEQDEGQVLDYSAGSTPVHATVVGNVVKQSFLEENGIVTQVNKEVLLPDGTKRISITTVPRTYQGP